MNFNIVKNTRLSTVIMALSLFLLVVVALAFAYRAFGYDIAAAPSCIRTPASTLMVDSKEIDTIGGNLPRAAAFKKGEYALTFDDGPWPITTPEIVRILQAKCVPATFFMIGRDAWYLRPITKAVDRAGFNIGSHSYSHGKMIAMSTNEARQEIDKGFQALEEVLDGQPNSNLRRLFRFPRWEYTQELLDYLRANSIISVFVDISPEDWRGLDVEKTFNLFRDRLQVKDRGVIVLHDTMWRTQQLLPRIIDEVRQRDGRFVKIDVH